MARGVIVRASAETIVVCPPLIITQAQIDYLVSVLDEAIGTVAGELSR